MDCKDKQHTPCEHYSPFLAQDSVTKKNWQPCESVPADKIQAYRADSPLNEFNSEIEHDHPGELVRFPSEKISSCRTHAFSSIHTQRFKRNHNRRNFRTFFSQQQHQTRHKKGNRKIHTHTKATSTSGKSVFKNRKPLSSKTPEPIKNIEATDYNEKYAKTCNASAPHVCRYCLKQLTTHSSLRRHQRRIHEHQLLTRRALKTFKIPPENEGKELVETTQNSQDVNPKCEDFVDLDEECMVGISSNISENLSFYIDGRLVSTSSISSCELINMNTGSSSVIGLNAVLIGPAQETRDQGVESQTFAELPGDASSRHRTVTPSFLSDIKTELESESIVSSLSSPFLSLPLSSMSGVQLVSSHFPQPIETVAIHNETMFYLSPELKHLVDQDENRPELSLIADGHDISSPLTATRFKRRTSSPPSSTHQTIDLNKEKQDYDCASLNKSTLESLLSNEETDSLGSPMNSPAQVQQLIPPMDCFESMAFGNSCNQQPLDLSNSVSKQEVAPVGSILDLSLSGSNLYYEMAGANHTQSALMHCKFNSSMLQKILSNEGDAVDNPSTDDQAAKEVFSIPDATNLNIGIVANGCPPNPEEFLFELALPPASINPISSLLAPISILPAATSPLFGSYLSDPIEEANKGIQTLPSSVLYSENTPFKDCDDRPLHLSQGNLKVPIPDWGCLEAQLPTAPVLSPHWATDPSALAQKALVADSVMASNKQMFSTPTDLSHSPNTVVIEYTVALHSTENILPIIQSSSFQSLPDTIPNEALQEPCVSSETVLFSPDNIKLSETTTELTTMQQPSSSGVLPVTTSTGDNEAQSKNEGQVDSQPSDCSEQDNEFEVELPSLHSFCKSFMCNVCGQPFQSMKILSQHVGEHSKGWPYKCEFCVQLFEREAGLLEHRSKYHGIGQIYVCKGCSKEFAFLCNMEQHQRDAHPFQDCSQSEVVHGKLRPENRNSPKTEVIDPGIPISDLNKETDITTTKGGRNASENVTEDLFTKIKTPGGAKPKTPDVRLGLNQHYPSFKPPPFPYHKQTPTETPMACAVHFTTHNIPQTFSTAIRCTKCGQSFDNMPELHKHILACANASDKKRYTPKNNPIPLNQLAKAQNGVLLPAKSVTTRDDLSVKHLEKQNLLETPAHVKMSVLNKNQSQPVRRGRPPGTRKAFAQGDLNLFSCPHCSREFTYSASLKKHVALSCPMRPASRIQRKRTVNISSTQENGRHRRQISSVNDCQTMGQK